MKRLLRIWQDRVLMDKDGDPAPGGGGSPAPNNDVAEQIAALKAEIAALKKGGAEPAPVPSDVDKVRKDLQDKAAKEAAVNRMQEAIRFNLSAGKFVEENGQYIGELSKGLFKELDSKPFSDEEKKASAVKKGLMDYFFSLQENIDAAPEELKGRIMTYKALADDEKEKQAVKYWDCLTLTVNQKKMSAQIEAAKRANGGAKPFEEGDDSRKQYNDRVFALKSHYLGAKQGE